jgi:thioredoxin-related protein
VSTTKNNKLMMLLLASVFILPVLLAKLALENDWFNQAATNKGELLSPIVDMSLLQTTEQVPKWKLLYVLPEVCSVKCENALYSIAQVRSALGKESDRAEVVVITHEKSNIAQLKEKQNIRFLNTNIKSLQQMFKETSTDAIFIADTLGNIILRFPLQIDEKQAILDSRDILSDMRKLLKLSRIG